MTCKFVLPSTHVLVGWGCCQCLTYNGLQRPYCKRCGHVCCLPDKPKPEAYGLCNECGVPLDGVGKMRTADGAILQHRGH